MTENNDTPKIFSLGQIDVSALDKALKEPSMDDLPLLPTRGFVLFPGITFPITLGRKSSVETIRQAEEMSLPIAVVCQLQSDQENPSVPDGINAYGVIAQVIKLLEIPGTPPTAIIHAKERIRILGAGASQLIPDALSVRAEYARDGGDSERHDWELSALVESIKKTAAEVARRVQEPHSDFEGSIADIHTASYLIDFVSTNLPFDTKDKLAILNTTGTKERAYMLLTALAKKQQMVEITEEIHNRTRESLSQQQRNVFLQQQMESIRQELYGEDDDAAMFRKKAESLTLTDDIRGLVDKEIDKLSRLNPQSPDYSVQYSYLDTLLSLPWGIEDPLTTTIEEAQHVLDADHYGLEKVKDRILEQLAVMMNTPDGRAPIICLVGAPGVGKTSLGQSVARALGRKYRRVALGGVHDEAEIRGHRRTYIGAMPGRIIDAIRRSESSNPVILLDEIDKIGNDYKGDPSAALLEVLDPEQNNRFHDNYVDVDFDLSRTFFIATANTLQGIPGPLLDRMEIIDLTGYVMEEKVEIARRHLIPRLRREHSLEDSEFDLSDAALVALIDGYTSESGVRQLEKSLSKLARRIVLAKVKGESWPKPIEQSDLESLLGAVKITRDRYEGNDMPGVVTGLAWTAAGGEILFIETSLAHDKSRSLTLTGSLGDVMKESGTLAMQYVRSNAREFGIDPDRFDTTSVHIHVPEGAIPKDGPSAGVTMTTSIVSAFTGRRPRPRTAMTGELTLRGKVVAVGGIKEKVLAAKRAGMTRIILPEANRKDVREIPERYLTGLEFVYAGTASDVIAAALAD